MKSKPYGLVFLFFLILFQTISQVYVSNANLEGLDYVFTEGTEAPYDVMHDTVHDAPGTPTSAATTEGSTSRNNQRKLVRTSDGVIYLVYRKLLGGKYQIYVKRSIDDGTTWIDNIRISTYTGMDVSDNSFASIAIDANDYLHVVWQGGATGFGITQIWYRNYTTAWNTVTRISIYDGSETGTQYYPSMAIDSKDYLHVVWGGINDTFSSIRYTNKTIGWSVPLNISTYAGMGLTHQEAPSIAVDSNDKLHVAWYGSASGFPTYDQIWYRKCSGSWGTVTRISTWAGMYDLDQRFVSIIADTDVHVVWSGRAAMYTHTQIWYNKYTTSWSGSIRISTYSGMVSYHQSRPSITLDSSSNVHVLWHGKAPGLNDYDKIWYNEYTDSWATPICLQVEGQNRYPNVLWSTWEEPAPPPPTLGTLHSGIILHTLDADITLATDIFYTRLAIENHTIRVNSTYWGIYPIAGSVEIVLNELSTLDSTIKFTADGTNTRYNWIWGDDNPYVAELNGSLTSVDIEECLSPYNRLVFKLAGSGRATSKVYCASKGKPQKITADGTDIDFTYNSVTKIVVFSTVLSETEIVVSWFGTPTVTIPDDDLTDDETPDDFDWGDDDSWYTNHSWVFEGKRRYHFQVDYQFETLGTVKQFGIRFTDEMDQIHTIWYNKDANTLTVTSPYDGISGWIHSFTQTETSLTAIFQIMFNKPIPDSYAVQLEIRIVADEDTGWLITSGGIFNIYNLGGLATLYDEGTAGRVPGGDVFEIYAADTRTRNIIPVEDFDVRAAPLPTGVQILGIQVTPAGDEGVLLDELTGWKWWLTTRTENLTIYPTNRLPSGAGTNDKTYVSYPFGLKFIARPTTADGLMGEYPFWRKITPADNEIVTVEVHAMTPQTTGTTGKILITDDGYVDDLKAHAALDSKQAVDLVFAGNGSIRLTNSTAGWIYPGTYTGMTWYNFTFVINCTAQNYDLYIDEILNATNIHFRQKVAGANSVGHITFMDMLMTGNYTEFYIDDLWVHTDFDEPFGGVAEATMLFDKNQHWSMDFDFFVEDGQVYAQGASGTPIRVDDDYSNYGYLEFGWDLMINKTMVHDFLVARVNITDGYISGKNDWVEFTISWYQNGTYVKNDILYGLFEGYSIFPGSSKDTIGWHWDIWFNRANASTVVGARINTEYYGMSDKSVWWAIWSSKWTAMRSEVSESTLFIDLEDVKGTIHSANDVSFVRSWVKVLRDTRGQFAYKLLNIGGLDFLIATDTMSGIDTPPIRDTLVPDVPSGFFGSVLGSMFGAALKRLGNMLAGFGMGFFTMSIAFIDNVFSALGYPALVSTIFSWMDSMFASVPTLVGYWITSIGQIFLLINISAGNTLTQLTAIITIWVNMYAITMDLLTGVLTPGINLWKDLGINSFIQIGAILYPFWLLVYGMENGMQAVIDHVNGVLNIGSFFLNFILNVAGFFVALLTGLIGAIRG